MTLEIDSEFEDTMSRTLNQLRSEALRLSAESRARLATTLIESLEGGAERVEREIEAMWADEAEQRLRQHEAGEVEAVPANEVLAEIRQRLRDKRTA